MTGPDENPRQDTQGWNAYWDKKNSWQGLFYDRVAEFYRRVIIRPSLNRFIKGNFSKGDPVLHAGCGSGQVDADIHELYFHHRNMDISPVAWKSTNAKMALTARPFGPASFKFRCQTLPWRASIIWA